MGKRVDVEIERADRELAAAPGDAAALVAATMARARSGRVGEALALLRDHAAARAAIAAPDLEKTMRALAAADPAHALECHAMLAREQLRFGDIEGARRTLDELPQSELSGPAGHRIRELRASALFRVGDSRAAREELELARSDARSEEDVSLTLALAEYAVARAELGSARRSLRALAPDTRERPMLEARRATALAMSHLFEDRYRRAALWARRARLSARKRGTVDPLIVMIEVLARLGLDEIDAAAALTERWAPREEHDGEVLGRGIRLLHRAATLWRRGDFAGCLAAAERGFEQLDRGRDQVARAVVAHYLARAAIGLGRCERAEELLRYLTALASDPGLALLEPIAERDLALLAETRGDREEALRHLKRARRRAPRSPYARIDEWALGGGAGAASPVLREDDGAVTAYLALRTAERAISRGDVAAAAEAARRAERWYRAAGVRWELSRALLVSAEASMEDASLELAEAEELARAHGYSKQLVELALVRASIADRSGDFEAYRRALASAIEHAGDELADPALAAACERAGVTPPRTVRRSTFARMVDRLRLTRPAVVRFAIGTRLFLLADDDREPACDVVFDASSGQLSPQLFSLAEQIAVAGDRGASIEALYMRAWGESEYHPLRHRNVVYVAINRLRKTLDRDVIVQTTDGLYRIASGVTAGVRRKTK